MLQALLSDVCYLSLGGDRTCISPQMPLTGDAPPGHGAGKPIAA